jgi:hypothetical protein
MKKRNVVAIVVAALCLAYLVFGGYYSSPIQGTLKSATVTKKYFVSTPANSAESGIEERTVHIQDPPSIAAIQSSLRNVWTHFGANRKESLPVYVMQVDYAGGKTETFVFTRAEWGGSGRTPKSLLAELEKHGL